MEGAHFQDVLFPDDFFEPQALGLAHVYLDDEGPLAFDVHLGHPVAHAAPNQAAGQDGPAFEDFAPPFMQPGLGNEDQPDLVDLEYELADEAPHHLPVALDAVEEVITFLQANLPELALHPNGPSLVLTLHAALGHYMLAHGMTVNAPETPLAPYEDLPQLDGFVEVADNPGDDNEAFVHWPEVQDDGDAGLVDAELQGLFEADDALAHLHNVLDHLGAAHEQHDAPLEPGHVHEVPLDAAPALVGEPEPVMQPELVVEIGNAAPENEVLEGAANVVEPEPEHAPPPYPAEPQPAEELGGDGEHGNGAIVNIDHLAEEVPPVELPGLGGPAGEDARAHSETALNNVQGHVPVTTTGDLGSSTSSSITHLGAMVRLGEDGRAALSSLCTRFDMVDDPSNVGLVLAEAERHIDGLQSLLNEARRREFPMSTVETPSAAHFKHAEKLKKPPRISFKFREVWKRAFPGSHSKGAFGVERATQVEAGLPA